ncbi:MAG: pantoate--beta-alanine ligase [Flavobacteriaceae bacterium]
MRLFKKQRTLQTFLAKKTDTIGFVPTMGALHQGHLSLIEKARKENTLVVVSIFVNPTQFDQTSDLDNYPRTLDADLDLLEKMDPNILVFAPDSQEIYGPQPSRKTYDFLGLDQVMEGKIRSGHFQGVATVVEKLFGLVMPQTAYFGEKDFQQLQIIRKLVADKNLPITVVGCPIIREKDGLAMSSRNRRLNPSERSNAPILFRALSEAQQLFRSQDKKTAYQHVEQLFEQQPNVILDYFTICEENTLTEVISSQQTNIRGFVAAQLGDIRLIDNLPF